MATKDIALSKLASTEEVISPPPMLAEVLSSVFQEENALSGEAQPPNPNITMRMLRVADLSSIAAGVHDAEYGLDYSAAKSLVLSLSIYNQLVDRGFTQDPEFNAKWRRLLEIANAAQNIAALYDPSLIERAYIAGLLHDFGRICLHRYFPEEAKMAKNIISEHCDVICAERAVFGTDHQEVGHLVAVKWNMPEQLTEIIGNHHAEPKDIGALSPLTRIIVMAGNLTLIRQKTIGSVKRDPSKMDVIMSAARSLGVKAGQLAKAYSILPKHCLYTADPDDDRPQTLDCLAKMNDELFGIYVELGQMFKERQELSKRLLMESKEEGRLESLKTAVSTLSHYINNAIMGISGKGDILRMLYDRGEKEAMIEQIPDTIRAIDKNVKKISVILQELSSIIDLNATKRFKDSRAIDIDESLKARLES